MGFDRGEHPFQGIRLPGLLVAAPSRRSLLRLDFANEAARNEFRGNLCRSARLHTLRRFEVAIVAPRCGAHHYEFGIGKFDEHGFDPSLWLGPSHSGPSPRRAPVRIDRRGEVFCAGLFNHAAITPMLCSDGNASPFWAAAKLG